jgi:hypothetical protein
MIPFLVADRPISLSIIKGISLPQGARVGILSQAATTSERFKQLFGTYPLDTDVVYPNGQPSDGTIRKQTLKMVDSGIFGKNGCHLEYSDLFTAYHRMSADYGIMIDVMRDRTATIKSARRAISEYRNNDRRFKLVGVAQGETTEEYFRCYEQLLSLGYDHIAIGGLLQKRVNTARYAHVRSKQLLEEVLRGIRKRFNPEWLFALGVLHPDRIELFEEVGVWGSDYKGWIFNYEKKDTVLDLLRNGNINGSGRIADKKLPIRQVKALTEQELRFHLTRSCIERRVIDKSHGRRLLVLACSGRKQGPRSETRKAWDLYDGVAYRLIKKAQRNGVFARDVDVMILSAKYGLISPSRRIGWYEQRIDRDRSVELKGRVTSRLRQIVSKTNYREVLLWMGKDYLNSFEPFNSWNLSESRILVARGSIGFKLAQLSQWIDKTGG